ncbi:toxin VasX [uncultured Desulfovibrio sp.]|uniref:toxin VasX n=1 Tax=uncultured Desulfovibrio sp. TaxID=167968 RepID=UPI0025D91C99|nr:toxin VasX [uncultured Desulfovibrio sp.]
MSRARFAVQDCEYHHLYIVRYALTHEKNKTFASYPLLGKRGGIIKDTVPNCPWDFHYTLRALRKGFIYVYNDGVWGEFTVAEMEAVRQTPFRIKVNPDWRQLHIAYSELSWSEDYRAYLLSHPEIMAQRMQLVKLQGDPKGNEHSANVDDYSALVEEYRERPGCLKSLSAFLPRLFQPLDLSYSGDKSRYPDEVGRRWRCSAIPFGTFDKRHPLEVIPQEMRYDRTLPEVGKKPYQQDSLLKPAAWTLPPAQKKSPPIHPFIIAVEDPLGEARDLNMVYQYSLEDIETYMDYYYYALLLANFFEELHISEEKNKFSSDFYNNRGMDERTRRPPREMLRSGTPHQRIHFLPENRLDKYVPGHPWFAFLKKYERETREMYAAMAAYVKPWTKWLTEEGAATVRALRPDFSLDPPREDADFKEPCEGIMAAMLHGMGDIPESASDLEKLFTNFGWNKFFQPCLLTTHGATQDTAVLLEVLAKAAAALIAQDKGNDIADYKTKIHNRIAEKLPRLSPIRKVDQLEDAPLSSMKAEEIIPYISEYTVPQQPWQTYKLDDFEVYLSLDKYAEYFSGACDVSKDILVPVREGMTITERRIRIIMNSVVVLFFVCKSTKLSIELAEKEEKNPLKKVKKIAETSNAIAGLCVAAVAYGNLPRLTIATKCFAFVCTVLEGVLNITDSLWEKKYALAPIDAASLAISAVATMPKLPLPPHVALILYMISTFLSIVKEIYGQEEALRKYLCESFWKKGMPTPFSYDRLFRMRNDNSMSIALPTDKDIQFFIEKMNKPVAVRGKSIVMYGYTKPVKIVFTIDCFPLLIKSDSIKIKIEESLGDPKNYCQFSALTSRSATCTTNKEEGTIQFTIYIQADNLSRELKEKYGSDKAHALYTRLSVEYQDIVDSSVKTIRAEMLNNVH